MEYCKQFENDYEMQYLRNKVVDQKQENKRTKRCSDNFHWHQNDDKTGI